MPIWACRRHVEAAPAPAAPGLMVMFCYMLVSAGWDGKDLHYLVHLLQEKEGLLWLPAAVGTNLHKADTALCPLVCLLRDQPSHSC